MSVDPVQIQLLDNGTSTPADTDYFAYAEQMGGGGYKAFKRSWLQVRNRLATLWNADIATSQALTPSTPSRTLDSNFTPSATKRVLCVYTISIASTITLGGLTSGAVELRSDTNATPTTVRSKVSNGNSGTIVIGLNMTNTQEAVLMYLCPPNHNVRLVSSGTATITITQQCEIAIG